MYTHTHTEWNTQVAAAAGFRWGCQRLQTPFSCWTYGSSLTLWNHHSRRALPTARIKQLRDKFLNLEAWTFKGDLDTFLSGSGDLIKIRRAQQCLSTVQFVNLILPYLLSQKGILFLLSTDHFCFILDCELAFLESILFQRVKKKKERELGNSSGRILRVMPLRFKSSLRQRDGFLTFILLKYNLL